ncbi:MAG: hypothetical protein ACO280_11125 [Pseudohongiellaceae bacterium]|jgi:hypothetical protein
MSYAVLATSGALMTGAVLALGLALLLGMALVVLALRRRRGSLSLALAHALSAVGGLGLLLSVPSTEPTNKLQNLAALLWGLALLGGLVLLALRLARREFRTAPPLFAVALHALLGVLALLLLLAS